MSEVVISPTTTNRRRNTYQKGSNIPFQARKMPQDYIPSPTTVIFGRVPPGGAPYSGNRRLHKVVSSYVNDYSKVQTRGDKIAIVTAIIEKMKEITTNSCNDDDNKMGNYPSFVVKKEDGYWYEAEPHKVRDKIGGILRERLHTKYKSSTKAKRRAEKMMKHRTDTQMTMNRLQEQMNRQKSRSCYLSKLKEELIHTTSPITTSYSSSNDDDDVIVELNPMSSFMTTTKPKKNGQLHYVPSSSLSVLHQKNMSYWGQQQMNVFMPLDHPSLPSHTTTTATTSSSMGGSCVSLDQLDTFQGATTNNMNDGIKDNCRNAKFDYYYHGTNNNNIDDDDNEMLEVSSNFDLTDDEMLDYEEDLETDLSPRIFDEDDVDDDVHNIGLEPLLIGLEPLPFH